MATVTITLTDEGKGINIKVESDPAFPGPANEDQTMTNAQHLGLHALGAINKACGYGDEGDE